MIKKVIELINKVNCEYKGKHNYILNIKYDDDFPDICIRFKNCSICGVLSNDNLYDFEMSENYRN